MVESPGSHTAATPAALEFALLEAWLASTRALQLPLHQIESQQQTKGREVSACCSRLISSAAAMEMWDLRCASHNNRQVRCYTPIVASAPAP
jgi:hypothetical protein